VIVMEDKRLEKILDEVKDAVRLVMVRYKQKNDSNLLDIGIEFVGKYIKLIEEGDKRSGSITEVHSVLCGMRDEMVDERDRNSNVGRL